MGLNFTESKDSTEVVAFVSPNKARFFTLPAELFFGVEEIFIDVSMFLVFSFSDNTSLSHNNNPFF